MSLVWTVVATPQGKEKYAQLNLERQGFVVYCPVTPQDEAAALRVIQFTA